MVIGFAVLGKLLVMLVLREPPRMSPPGTKRNCPSAHGISAAEGRPAVPSTGNDSRP
jgi:hypothetical protein